MRPKTHQKRAEQHHGEPDEEKPKPGSSDVVRIGLEQAGDAGEKVEIFNVNKYACWATGARSTFHWV